MSEVKSHTPIQHHIFICAMPTKAECHSGTLGLSERLRGESCRGDLSRKFRYHSMTVEKLERIITENLIGGKVVK